MTENSRDNEWVRLYKSLGATLAQFGCENAFGDGDYWLVDDDYGGRAQKVCVHKIEFLSASLIAAIQVVLGCFPTWYVVLQLELQINGRNVPPEGLIIHPDRVEQCWDQNIFANVIRDLGI